MCHSGLRGLMLPTSCDPLPLDKVGCITWGFRHDGSSNWRCGDKGGRGGKGKGVMRTRNQRGWWQMETGCAGLEGKREVESSVYGGRAKEPTRFAPLEPRLKAKLRKSSRRFSSISLRTTATQSKPDPSSLQHTSVHANEDPLCGSLTFLTFVFVSSQSLQFMCNSKFREC